MRDDTVSLAQSEASDATLEVWLEPRAGSGPGVSKGATRGGGLRPGERAVVRSRWDRPFSGVVDTALRFAVAGVYVAYVRPLDDGGKFKILEVRSC